jgi:hypothetical protein
MQSHKIISASYCTAISICVSTFYDVPATTELPNDAVLRTYVVLK